MAQPNDPRHCPRCGALGILPLDQPRGPSGEIRDPTMVCPVCDQEFTATDWTWLGATRPPVDGTEEELEAWVDAFVDRIIAAEGSDPTDAV